MNFENDSADSLQTLAQAAENHGFPLVREQLRLLQDLSLLGDSYIQGIAGAIEKISDAFISVGDFASQQAATFPNQHLQFIWSRQAMLYLRLWRDNLLENKKARVLYQLKHYKKAQLQVLKDQSIKQLMSALGEWEQSLSLSSTQAESEQKKALYKWSKEKSPWPVYREQIQEIVAQSKELATTPTDQITVAKQLTEIRGLLSENAELQVQKVQQQKEQLETLISIIAEVRKEDTPRANRISKYISEIESHHIGLQHEGDLRLQLGQTIQLLPQQDRVYISVKAGMLQYKDINYRSSVQQWIDSEVLPILYETWEETERAEAQLLLALANIRNRLTAQDQLMREGEESAADQSSAVIPADLEMPLVNFLQTTDRTIASLEDYINPLKEKLNKELCFERIFDESVSFLPRTALQARLRNLQGAQTAIWTRFRNWLLKARQQLLGWLDRAKREDQLSLSEKVVRAVASRKKSVAYPSYANIFITRGYVGESFFAGREVQLDRMRQLVQSWEEGYRGAVVLTGRRQSGKSLFGELSTNRFFAGKVIRLRPGQMLDVKGRKLQLGQELRPALEFIKKHTINQQVAIWIDDLELWSDKKHRLGENVQFLQHFIDVESQKFFFLVSCGTAIFHRMDCVFSLNRTFQARIHLGRIPLADLSKAIYIRHGATHETLLLEDGEKATDADFGKLCRRVHRAADGNIGDALRLWAAGIHEHPAGGVYAKMSQVYSLPPFLKPDSALLLSTLIRKRKADEYHLRQLFGPGFPERFRYVLRRLQGVGLLNRLENGELEVEPSIVNELGQLLQRNGYLTHDK